MKTVDCCTTIDVEVIFNGRRVGLLLRWLYGHEGGDRPPHAQPVMPGSRCCRFPLEGDGRG